MMSFWRLAFRNLGRNRKRNFATGSAMAFGFAGILLLTAYAYRAKNYLRVYTVYVVHTGHLIVFPKNGFEKFAFEPEKFSLSAAEQEKILGLLKADPAVERFERQIHGQGLVGNGCVSLPFMARGYEPEVDHALREHPQVKLWMPKFRYLLQGRGLEAYPPELGALLLSRGLSSALGKTRLHDQFPESAPVSLPDCEHPKEQAAKDSNVQLLSGAWAGNLSAVDGEVVGLFTTGVQETDSSAIMGSVELLQKLFSTDRVAQIAVWLKNPDTLEASRAKLAAQLGEDFEVLRWNEERLSPYYVGTVNFLDTLIRAGGLVLSTIIALSVLNSATMTVLERSQEVGMYRSMGFRRRHIRQLYVQESLLLSFFSLLCGGILGIVAIRLINAADILYHPPGVAGGLYLILVLPAGQAIGAGTFILLLALLATLFAVSTRLRQTPADLLGGTLR